MATNPFFSSSRFSSYLLACLFSFVLLACGGSNKDKNQLAEEDREFSDPDRQRKTKDFHAIRLEQVLPTWQTHWQAYLPNFSINDFSLSFEATLPDTDFEAYAFESIHPGVQKRLIADGKKSKYLDLYSSVILLAPGQEISMLSLNQETEVLLVNATKDQAQRLLYLTGSERVEDAVFLPNGSMLIAGTTEQIDGTAPFLWLIKNGKVQGWLCQQNANYDNVSYLELLFPDFSF